ncbi:MAG: WbqC family protein [Balneolales bacterium]
MIVKKPELQHSPQPSALALLLPGYSPGLAWMACALNAGRVLLDDLHPFSRKSKVHRTKIRTPDGHQWLTLPIISEDRGKPINRVRMDERRPWLMYHLRALEFNYRNSLYYDLYEPEIRSDLEAAAECELLIDAIRHLMERQWAYLDLGSFPEWMSGRLSECSGNDTERALPMEHPDATSQTSGNNPRDNHIRECAGLSPSASITIWQEPDSRNYQKPHPNAVPSSFTPPEYRQHFPGFVPGCGILDLLFEYGPEAWMILDRMIDHH